MVKDKQAIFLLIAKARCLLTSIAAVLQFFSFDSPETVLALGETSKKRLLSNGITV